MVNRKATKRTIFQSHILNEWIRIQEDWRRRGSQEQKRTASWRERDTERERVSRRSPNTAQTVLLWPADHRQKNALIASPVPPVTSLFKIPGFTFHLPPHWPSLSGGQHFSRDVLAVTMEFSCPPAANTLPVPLQRSTSPSDADWFPDASAPQLSRSGPPESRWAELEPEEPVVRKSLDGGAPGSQVGLPAAGLETCSRRMMLFKTFYYKACGQLTPKQSVCLCL